MQRDVSLQETQALVQKRELLIHFWVYKCKWSTVWGYEASRLLGYCLKKVKVASAQLLNFPLYI